MEKANKKNKGQKNIGEEERIAEKSKVVRRLLERTRSIENSIRVIYPNYLKRNKTRRTNSAASQKLQELNNLKTQEIYRNYRNRTNTRQTSARAIQTIRGSNSSREKDLRVVKKRRTIREHGSINNKIISNKDKMSPTIGSGSDQIEDYMEKTKQVSKLQSDKESSSSDSEEEAPTTSKEDAKRNGKIMDIVNKNIPLFYGKQGPHLAAEVTTLLTAVDHVDLLLGNKEERRLFLSFVKVRFREDAATQIKRAAFKSLKKLKAHMLENYMPPTTCTDCRAKLMNAKQNR